MTLGDRLIIMKAGVVQQCGAPLEIYNRPANRFVAEFVGTPPMNVLDGRIESDSGAVFFAGDVGRLRLPPEFTKPMTPHVGRTASLGIRPEHLRIDGADARFEGTDQAGPREGRVASIQACVTVVEPLGDSINVHLAAPGGNSMVARVSPTVTVSPGQNVNLNVDLSHAHLFSAGEVGERLV